MSSPNKLNTSNSKDSSNESAQVDLPELSSIESPLARRAVKAAHSFLSQAQQCSKTRHDEALILSKLIKKIECIPSLVLLPEMSIEASAFDRFSDSDSRDIVIASLTLGSGVIVFSVGGSFYGDSYDQNVFIVELSEFVVKGHRYLTDSSSGPGRPMQSARLCRRW